MSEDEVKLQDRVKQQRMTYEEKLLARELLSSICQAAALVVLKSYLFALGALTTRVCHNILCIQRGQQTGMTGAAEVQCRKRHVTVIVSPYLFFYTL